MIPHAVSANYLALFHSGPNNFSDIVCNPFLIDVSLMFDQVQYFFLFFFPSFEITSNSITAFIILFINHIFMVFVIDSYQRKDNRIQLSLSIVCCLSLTYFCIHIHRYLCIHIQWYTLFEPNVFPFFIDLHYEKYSEASQQNERSSCISWHITNVMASSKYSFSMSILCIAYYSLPSNGNIQAFSFSPYSLNRLFICKCPIFSFLSIPLSLYILSSNADGNSIDITYLIEWK